MKSDGWEYEIYKELKGEINVARIFNSSQHTLRKHGDFYIHHQHYSYIRLYGSTVEPYQLPRYVKNRMLLMEMMRQFTYLHEYVWQNKSTTSNLLIIVGEYQCRAWADVNSMIEELVRYNFKKMPVATHYDPKNRIHEFYMKERKKAYKYRPLRDKESFRNINTEVEVKKIHAKMQEEAHKQ